jgi:hypothetical protein
LLLWGWWVGGEVSFVLLYLTRRRAGSVKRDIVRARFRITTLYV